MTLDEMKALVRRHDNDVINRKDLSALDRDLAPDYIDHAAPPDAPQGVEGARAWLSMIHGAFPDLKATIEDIVAEGDRIVIRKRWTGTHRGPFLEVEPTGKDVEFEGMVIWRIEGGRLAERWAQIDRLGLLQRLGVLPAGFSPAPQRA